MAVASGPFFRTFHALRIKGFAKADTIAEVADLHLDEVEEHLRELHEKGWAMFREARQLWQLTADGHDAHGAALAADIGDADLASALYVPYREFLALDEKLKTVFGDWQNRDGSPNDHSDPAHDRAVVERLAEIDNEAGPTVAAMGEVLPRLAPYGPRLERTCQRVLGGETNMFTGVMCGSYHDVWMELHEDLILTQGFDRSDGGVS